jgi:hypothetical protein
VDLNRTSPAQSPFPIAFSRRPLPDLTLRVGYTHWWTSGNGVSASSDGVAILVRFAVL